MNIHTQQEYLDLVKELIAHDKHYYDEAKPVISDFEYDQKMKALVAYEKAHPEHIAADSPAQKIGEAPTEGFVQKEHMVPMMSLGNTYSAEEINDFLQRVHKALPKENISFCCELKMDGTAISLRYEKGKLLHALTRGNGRVGDDVTSNIKTIASVPSHLSGTHIPDIVEVRGEVYMTLATFRSLNASRQEEGLEPFANPRNAAAGSLKLLDPKEAAKRKLNLVCYGVAEGQLSHFTQIELHKHLKAWGLPVAHADHVALCENLHAIMEFANAIHKKRENLPFEIDGIVVKVNELKLHTILGATGKVPRYAIAYKYAPEQAHTRVLEITVQVGRSGVLTPVAELEPVLLAGSTISRATLHNQDEIKRKDIRVGDFVVIEKGGDVIPKVVSVDVKKRPHHTQIWHMPTHCPICKTHVVSHPDEVAVRCPNPKCIGQRKQRIVYFASKHAMDIEHLGEKVVEQLVEHSLVSRLSDLYLLDANSLSQLEGFKEKSIQNLLRSIEASKHCTLSRFIMGLGIKYVGVQTAELLAETAHTLDHLMRMSESELVSIEGIGEKTAHAIAAYFRDPSNQEEIDLLRAHGVHPQKPKAKIHNHSFSDKTFVLTGTLLHYTRDAAASLIKERGGKVTNAVTQNTDFLLLGEDPGSKYDKAKKLKVTILSEEQFQKML